VRLINSQVSDALVFMRALEIAGDDLSNLPDFGDGLRLTLPPVIPLHSDYKGEGPRAWLVANDFGGYDLTTEEPSNK